MTTDLTGVPVNNYVTTQIMSQHSGTVAVTAGDGCSAALQV